MAAGVPDVESEGEAAGDRASDALVRTIDAYTTTTIESVTATPLAEAAAQPAASSSIPTLRSRSGCGIATML